MIKIFLIDDHAILRQGIRLVIERDQDIEVVGEAGDSESAVATVAQTQPDVILLDLDLSGQSGIELIAALKQVAASARILILTGTLDPEAHLKAMRAGSLGLVLKGKAVEELLPAIHKVFEGELWFDQTMLQRLLGAQQQSREKDPEQIKIETLTGREREIIKVVGEGLKNRQIGERLFISEGTVKQHMATIFGKLDVRDRFELIMYAYRHGLASPPLQKNASS